MRLAHVVAMVILIFFRQLSNPVFEFDLGLVCSIGSNVVGSKAKFDMDVLSLPLLHSVTWPLMHSSLEK